LDAGDRDVLRVFLASRGNIKELERHLGVSYPTARARFDELIRKLGLTAPAAAPASDPRLNTLQALADGKVDIEQARRLIEDSSG
jgi:hypothetical protein